MASKPLVVDEDKHPENRKASVTILTAEIGRAPCLVNCNCGHTFKAYKWSWAGHGSVRCKVCNRRHGYRELMRNE